MVPDNPSSISVVTENKQTETHQRLQNLLENLHLVSAMLDQAGNITFCNDFLLRLTGWKREEIIGRNWCELSILSGQYDRAQFVKQLSEGTIPSHYESEIITKAGTCRVIAWNNMALFDAADTPIGAATIGEDITERIRLESELRQAQKLESIGRLAGAVAHDFNNLLTVINGNTDCLLTELHPSDSVRSYAEEITLAGKHAARLTKQILEFSRQGVLEPQMLELNDIIRESERTLRRLIGDDVILTTSLDPLLGQVMAHPAQLDQVIMNLLVNASHAMPDGGGVTLSTINIDLCLDNISAHPDARPGSYIMMTVTDNGIGMDERTRKRIFEPFFTTKARGKGTGLGLATVYEIVRRNSGWIEVTSELGVGSSFTLYFPRLLAVRAAA